ncbi:MAG TPA: ABC transporter permease [Longimicrobiales bacterium]
MIRMTRLRAIARKEILQLRRDRRSLALAFVLPVLLVIIFAYGISWDVNDIRTVVVDQDASARSRALINAFQASGHFTMKSTAATADIDSWIDRGRAQLALVIPPDFSNELGSGTSQVQAVVDGSDANTATIVLGYTRAVVEAYTRELLAQAGAAPSPAVRVQTRVWYNEELLSRNMIVPGLVAVIMMIIAAMLTSLTIAREWERGTMEQLASTPVRRGEVVLGKLLPYLAIGIIDVVIASLLGVLLFDVPFRGNVALLMIASALFLTGALGLGMFISAATRSQLLATQVAMVVTFLPAFLLSGFMYSVDVMPRGLQAVTFLIPARYFVVVTRGVFLKGVGVGVLHTQALMMIAFAALGLILSIRAFRKEIA